MKVDRKIINNISKIVKITKIKLMILLLLLLLIIIIISGNNFEVESKIYAFTMMVMIIKTDYLVMELRFRIFN
jgi:hypothetical protein